MSKKPEPFPSPEIAGHETFEDGMAHEQFRRQLIEAHAPVGALETELAAAIAEDRWRIARLGDFEYDLFAQGHNDGLTEAQTFMSHLKEFDRISLDESRIHRRIDRNTRQLAKLQSARKTAETRALKEAMRLAEIAESRGEGFNPEDYRYTIDGTLVRWNRSAGGQPPVDGFGFSAETFNRHRDYSRRLAEARRLAKTGRQPANGKIVPIDRPSKSGRS